MKLMWLGQAEESVEPKRWTRMEKLTAAGILLGVVGFVWQISTQRKK